MPDRTNRTPQRAHARTCEDWADRFLAVLRSATVSDAARAAGVGRSTVYDRRDRDAEFRQAWDDVVEQSVEELELEARKRAMEGSDQLLMFLLRARRPKVFSERYRVEHAGRIEAPPAAMVDIADHLDPEAQAAANEFLRAVGHARERRLAKEGKLGLTPAEVDERHKHFDAAWSRRN
jgi:hypothetical protein